MRLLALPLALAATLVAHAPVTPPITGPLEVRGNLLVDTGTGAAVTLRGVAVDEASAVVFGVIRVRWNMNSVRLPVSLVAWQQDGERYLDRLASDVRTANDAGLFVILAAKESTSAFWVAMAARFKDNQRVMFSVPADQALIEAMRAAGARQVIAASSQALVQGPNIIYEVAAGAAASPRGPLYVGEFDLGPGCACSTEALIQTLTDFDTRSVSWSAAPFRDGGLVKDLTDFEATPLGEVILLWTTGDPGGFGLLRADMIANSAGGLAGPVAPGELVTIYTEQLGPAAGAAARWGADGKLPIELEGSTVFFDGAAVPLLFAGAFQINVQVPYELRPGTRATVQVFFRGIPSNRLSVNVTESAPEIFQDFATRYALALNEDGSRNGPANPARSGSIVVLFASGGGQTAPAGRTGTPAVAPHPMLLLPAAVTVDGRSAGVLFAGEVPGNAGLVQVNARLPVFNGAAARPAPVVLRVGDRSSQGAVLLWIAQ
jgi:uncharacterized protein (TIGR03437 family)